MKKIQIIFLFFMFIASRSFAVDYNASAFGCVSDGQTNNTRSIQAAIDLISSKGGGTLNFYVGRYLTGGLELKSNVTIQLHEGAILVANPSFYDFIEKNGKRYFIYAENQSNIKIVGKGVILGQAAATIKQLAKLQQNAVLPKESKNPILIGIKDCKQVTVEGLHVEDAASDVYVIENSSEISISNQIIQSLSVPNSNAFVLSNVQDLNMDKIYIDVTGKSFIKDHNSKTIVIKNSVNKEGKSIK